MSKYSQLRSIMGGNEHYNDKTKYGRVLKWYNDSCGLSKPAFMLSIGRLDGIKNFSQRMKNVSVSKKWFGIRHSNVVGKPKRASQIINSCKSVVPVRQWPTMKIVSLVV